MDFANGNLGGRGGAEWPATPTQDLPGISLTQDLPGTGLMEIVKESKATGIHLT